MGVQHRGAPVTDHSVERLGEETVWDYGLRPVIRHLWSELELYMHDYGKFLFRFCLSLFSRGFSGYPAGAYDPGLPVRAK